MNSRIKQILSGQQASGNRINFFIARKRSKAKRYLCNIHSVQFHSERWNTINFGERMIITAENIKFDNGSMWIELTDGRVIDVPLTWFPRLSNSTADELENFSLSPYGIHWGEIDEDISIVTLRQARANSWQT